MSVKHTCCSESCRITTKLLLNKTNFLSQTYKNAHYPLTVLKIIQHTFLSDVWIQPTLSGIKILFIDICAHPRKYFTDFSTYTHIHNISTQLYTFICKGVSFISFVTCNHDTSSWNFVKSAIDLTNKKSTHFSLSALCGTFQVERATHVYWM